MATAASSATLPNDISYIGSAGMEKLPRYPLSDFSASKATMKAMTSAGPATASTSMLPKSMWPNPSNKPNPMFSGIRMDVLEASMQQLITEADNCIVEQCDAVTTERRLIVKFGALVKEVIDSDLIAG